MLLPITSAYSLTTMAKFILVACLGQFKYPVICKQDSHLLFWRKGPAFAGHLLNLPSWGICPSSQYQAHGFSQPIQSFSQPQLLSFFHVIALSLCLFHRDLLLVISIEKAILYMPELFWALEVHWRITKFSLSLWLFHRDLLLAVFIKKAALYMPESFWALEVHRRIQVCVSQTKCS